MHTRSDADGVVKLWDLASFRPRLSFPTPTGPAPTANAPPFKGVLSLHPLPNQQLLTQLRGGVLMTWDLGDGGGSARPVGPQIATGAYHFCKAALCPSSSQPLLLAPTAESGAFCLWDLRAAGTGPALRFSAPAVEEGEGGSSSSLAAMAGGGGGGGGRGLCMALQLLLDDSEGGHALAAYEDGSVHAFDLRMASSRATCGAKLVKETGACVGWVGGTAVVLDLSYMQRHSFHTHMHVCTCLSNAALSMDMGPSRTRGVVGSAGSELVVFGLDLAQVNTNKQRFFAHATSLVTINQSLLTSNRIDHQTHTDTRTAPHRRGAARRTRAPGRRRRAHPPRRKALRHRRVGSQGKGISLQWAQPREAIGRAAVPCGERAHAGVCAFAGGRRAFGLGG